MNESIESLEPKVLWHYFNEICKVPRPSKREGKMVEYIKNFGESLHLETLVDEAGNVLIRKSATPGYEKAPWLLLQSHMDMVAEKNHDVKHDFDNDPIQPYIDGEWVKARGTTLGADDGMGVAAELAILASNDLQHGPIECLFTVDEETGLTGAKALKPGILKSKLLVNLDSEEDGDFCIGCAGGVDTAGLFRYQSEKTPDGLFFFNIEIKGLQGGHSGEDINKNRGNAVYLLARYLWRLKKKTPVYLAKIDGGNLRNAIAREAYATVGVPMSAKENIRIAANLYLHDVEEEYPNEPDLKVEVESETAPACIIEQAVSNRLIDALVACPHGVQGMSQDIKGLVETSTNLASVKMIEGQNQIRVATSQRSSVASHKEEIKNKVGTVLSLAGAEVSHGDGYPSWKPNLNSEIKNVLVNAYTDLFGKAPNVRAIHAGLECGLFLEKYPDLDMISVGPTMIGNHSPAERVEIKAVARFWQLITEVMKRIK